MENHKSFMSPDELQHIRKVVLNVSQVKLAQELTNPMDGTPIRVETVSRWESGRSNVPLWAARRIREFERVARIYDEEVKENGVRPD
jgi:DNA-binding transcriptional regulator YiaG